VESGTRGDGCTQDQVFVPVAVSKAQDKIGKVLAIPGRTDMGRDATYLSGSSNEQLSPELQFTL